MSITIKKLICTLTCTLALGLGLCAISTSALAVDLKIGIVDMRQIMANSNESKAVQARMKKEFAPREQELLAREKSFKDVVEKLQRNAAIMSPAERAKLEADAGAKQKELQRLQTKLQEDFAQRQRDEMQKLLEKLQKAVSQVAVQNKLDLVLINDAVLFAQQQPDITPKVIQALGGK